jgi:hypothetical protein
MEKVSPEELRDAMHTITCCAAGSPSRGPIPWRAQESESTLNAPRISSDEARKIGAELGIKWEVVNLDQFRQGLEVELEHGARDPETNVTNDDLRLTGKIAWAHLKEFPDYYTRLQRLEADAKAHWASRR